MIKKNLLDVQEEIVTKANSTKTTIRWLITKEDGAQYFATRRYEIQPGGQVGLHAHPEDHHIYILQGNAEIFNDKGIKEIVKPNDTIYIPPNEFHGVNNIGEETLAFIAMIPYL